MIFKEFYPAIELAEHAVIMLARLEQQRAILMLRTVDPIGPIESRADLDSIEQPAGLVRERAAQRPGRIDFVAVFVALEVETAQIEVELGITKESRCVL